MNALKTKGRKKNINLNVHPEFLNQPIPRWGDQSHSHSPTNCDDNPGYGNKEQHMLHGENIFVINCQHWQNRKESSCDECQIPICEKKKQKKKNNFIILISGVGPTSIQEAFFGKSHSILSEIMTPSKSEWVSAGANLFWALLLA